MTGKHPRWTDREKAAIAAEMAIYGTLPIPKLRCAELGNDLTQRFGIERSGAAVDRYVRTVLTKSGHRPPPTAHPTRELTPEMMRRALGPDPLPAGHPVTWDAIALNGEAYDGD